MADQFEESDLQLPDLSDSGAEEEEEHVYLVLSNGVPVGFTETASEAEAYITNAALEKEASLGTAETKAFVHTKPAERVVSTQALGYLFDSSCVHAVTVKYQKLKKINLSA